MRFVALYCAPAPYPYMVSLPSMSISARRRLNIPASSYFGYSSWAYAGMDATNSIVASRRIFFIQLSPVQVLPVKTGGVFSSSVSVEKPIMTCSALLQSRLYRSGRQAARIEVIHRGSGSDPGRADSGPELPSQGQIPGEVIGSRRGRMILWRLRLFPAPQSDVLTFRMIIVTTFPSVCCR